MSHKLELEFPKFIVRNRAESGAAEVTALTLAQRCLQGPWEKLQPSHTSGWSTC